MSSPYGGTNPDPDPDAPDDVPNTVTATFTDTEGGTVTDTADRQRQGAPPVDRGHRRPAVRHDPDRWHVDYTYTLTNTGDIAITNPVVTAANCTPVIYHGGDTNSDGLLDVTETWTYTCATGPLTADVPTATVTATGNALIFATPVDDDATVSVNVIDPSMTVVKTAQDNKVGGATGDAITVGYPNSVTYHYALTNTGNAALSSITALDNKCPSVAADRIGANIIGDLNTNGLLDPDETWQYSCGPVQLEAETTNAVQFDATYSVDGLSGTVSATDTAHVDVMRPKLLLTKEASATRARIDGQVTYTYLITNTGATSFLRSGFSTPVLTDDKCETVTFSRWLVDRAPLESLDPPIPADPNNPADLGTPGDVIEYTCTTTLSADKVEDDRVLNTVTTGTATDTLGSTYTPTPATATVFVIDPGPGFSVEKKATTTLGGPADAVDGEAGKPVAYTFTIAHSITTPYGNFLDDLNALALDVADDKCSTPVVALDANGDGIIDGDTDNDGSLDPGDGLLDLGETWKPSGDTNTNGVVDPYEVWTSGGVTFGDTNTDGIQDPDETWTTDGFIYGDTSANALLNPGETFLYSCRLDALPDGVATVNEVTVTGTVVERTLNPDGTPTEPNDGLAPIVHTDTATVTPLSQPVTVIKKALNCDVGVPMCDLPGGEFTLYSSDPLGPTPGTPIPLTNDPAGSATFVSAKLLLNHDYWLVETSAPDGFQLLAQPVKFHLTKDELSLDEGTSSLITVDSSTFTITIVDVPAAQLPKAGGEGSLPFLGLGLLLVAGASVYYRSSSRALIAPRRAM